MQLQTKLTMYVFYEYNDPGVTAFEISTPPNVVLNYANNDFRLFEMKYAFRDDLHEFFNFTEKEMKDLLVKDRVIEPEGTSFEEPLTNNSSPEYQSENMRLQNFVKMLGALNSRAGRICGHNEGFKISIRGYDLFRLILDTCGSSNHRSEYGNTFFPRVFNAVKISFDNKTVKFPYTRFAQKTECRNRENDVKEILCR